MLRLLLLGVVASLWLLMFRCLCRFGRRVCGRLAVSYVLPFCYKVRLDLLVTAGKIRAALIFLSVSRLVLARLFSPASAPSR